MTVLSSENLVKLIEDAATVAARWWADRLREATGNVREEPMFDPAGLSRDRDVGLDRAIAMDVFTRMARAKSTTTAAHCDEFEKLLRAAICEHLITGQECWRDVAGWDDGGNELRLHVDYHPEKILFEAMLQAGVEKSMREMFGLPNKTDMKISARCVEVSHGYGTPWKCIHGPVWGCTYEERRRFNDAMYKGSEEYREWLRTLSHEERERVDPILSEHRPHWHGPVMYEQSDTAPDTALLALAPDTALGVP